MSAILASDAKAERPAVATFEPITGRGFRVLMFGSSATASALSKVMGSLWDYLNGEPNHRSPLVLDEHVRTFAAAARRDLGAGS